MKQLRFLNGPQFSTNERIEYIDPMWKQILSGVQKVYKNMKADSIDSETQTALVGYQIH